jgi:hypothetical protein
VRKWARGSVLIASLLLSSIILLVGLGFWGKRRAQYQATLSQRGQMVALSLAEAGLEEARIKLLKDRNFPPWQEGQQSFSYRENLAAGSYEVILRRLPRENPPPPNNPVPGAQPNEYILVECIGSAGPVGAPNARRRIQAEMVTRGVVLSFRDLGGF